MRHEVRGENIDMKNSLFKAARGGLATVAVGAAVVVPFVDRGGSSLPNTQINLPAVERLDRKNVGNKGKPGWSWSRSRARQG